MQNFYTKSKENWQVAQGFVTNLIEVI